MVGDGRLRPLDPRATRDALLSALEATVFAGWGPSAAVLQEIARTAQDLPTMGDSPADTATQLLLQGYTARATRGFPAAVPALRRAVQIFLADEMDPDVLSPSTVEYHLRKVFRKLGVTSRTQLAHRVINQGVSVRHPPHVAERPPVDRRR